MDHIEVNLKKLLAIANPSYI